MLNCRPSATFVITLLFISGYVEDIYSKVFELCRRDDPDLNGDDKVPPPLCSQYEKPEKSTAVANHKSRFSLL